MKMISVVVLAFSLTSIAHAKSNFTGKCAEEAAQNVRASFQDAVAEGLFASVVSANVTKNRSVYQVVVAVMDGSGEPFAQYIDVTLDPKTCVVSGNEFSK